MLKNFKYVMFAGYPLKVADSSIGFWQYQDYLDFESKAKFEYKNELFKFSNLNLHLDFGNSKPILVPGIGIQYNVYQWHKQLKHN